MADQGIGDPANPKATDSTSSWTVISLLKAIVGNTGGGGSAVSIADGSDVAEGATSDAAITAGATGTVSAKLRAISRDIATLLTNTTAIATSAKQDTGNTSLSTIVTNTTGLATSAKQDTTITDLGGVTETVPANDTASSGLNGRLQRIAQNITTLFGRFVAAATLGDAITKPSTTIVGAWLIGYNGATGDLVRVSTLSYDMSAIAITTIATVATPASGKQIRLMNGTFSVSAACSVLFENNAGGSTVFRTPQLLANTPYSFDLGNGRLVTTANHVLKATASTGTVTITGTLNGVEE